MRSPRLVIAASLSLLLPILASCAPTNGTPTSSASSSESTSPSPTPTPPPTAPPPLGELVLTTEGLGDLTITGVVSESPTSIVWFDPDACLDVGFQAGDPLAARWRANYPVPDGARAPFGVSVTEDGVLVRLDLFTSDIPTDTGLRVGDPIDELMVAHPASVTPVLEGPVTSVYVIQGQLGQLFVEALSTEGYSEYAVGTIVAITLVDAATAPFGKWGSDNVAGGCL